MFAASKSGSAAEATDAQFNYVTMLLHGDGTNGAQNNTFLDSSTNNFTITRNGNTTQGTFTPYGSNWSNYFDGSGDRLTVPANAAFNFSTGDFTVELWFYANSVSGNQWIIGPDNTVNYPWVMQTVGTAIRFISNNAANDFRPTSFTLATGTWNHFAVTRSGSTMYWFTNGTLNGTQTYSTAIGSNTIDLQIGTTGSGSGDPTNGYVSNLRVVKGTAVYTSSFTPSTTPLTAITNTSLLTCQSNRFIDNSSNAFTITKYNDVSVQRFSPFSPTSAYSTSVIGGSGYFDGSGDTLSLASQTALNFGTGDFTLEAWVYATTTLGDATCIFTAETTGGMMFGTNGSAGSGVWAIGRKNTAWDYSSSTVPALNQWQHVAVCRSGTSVRIFINGVQSGTTGTNSTAYNLGLGGTVVGYQVNYMNGYFSSIRATNTALYTTTFTPPSAPLTVVSGTALLLLTTNAGILDNAMMNDLETVGNAQISTSVKKYGTGSMLFDGNGDYAISYNPNLYIFGTGDFTVEAWVYPTSFPAEAAIITTATSTDYQGFTVNVGTSGNIIIALGAGGSWTVVTTSGGTLTANTWQHIALTRSGNVFRMFVSGTQSYTTTNSVSLTNTNNAISVGGRTAGGGQYFNGYIDDVRISKGLARYTSTFTPSTTAFADKG
jgi:hypothetical protein